MRISDWSSDVCSSDLPWQWTPGNGTPRGHSIRVVQPHFLHDRGGDFLDRLGGGRQPRNAFPPHHAFGLGDFVAALGQLEIGRASCRERVCQYVSYSVAAVTLKKKKNDITTITH